MGISGAVVSLAVLCALASCVQAKTTAARAAPALKDAGDDYCRACKDGSDPPERLIRGSDEVKLCEDGYYCDCVRGKKRKCRADFPMQFRFDPSALSCAMPFDCKKWLDSHPVPGPTGQPPTGQPPTGQPPTNKPSSSKPPSDSTSTPSPKPDKGGASLGQKSTIGLMILGVIVAAL